MATTSDIKYCTDNQLLEIYPQLSEYDLKKRITGWTIDDNYGYAYNTGSVSMLYSDGAELGAAQSASGDVDAAGEWFYDSATDRVWYYFGSSNTSPNDKVMESGKDWATIKSDFLKKSSRMLESLLDSRLSRQIKKDREGNYPEFIVRATGLQTIYLLITANDPENEIAASFKEEFNEIIEGYRSGLISLPHTITKDSANGVIREVLVDAATDLRLVELMGSYNAFGYDLIKVKVTAGDVLGTATYSVWIKDQDNLKSSQCITDGKITGDYDHVANGLYMRFAGDDDAAVCTTNDEYEIEVHGSGMDVSNSQAGTISMTRR